MARSNRRLTRWLVLAALVICFVLLQRELWFSAGGLPHGWHLAAAVHREQQANAALSKSNARHQEEIKNLKHGTAAVEEHAREDLGLVKKGETFYQIVRVPGTAPAAASARSSLTAPVPRTGAGGSGG